jgi:uncharacterized protein YuzE
MGLGANMRIEYVQKADLLYVRFDPRPQEVINRRVSEDIVLDVGAGERIVGIEILNASRNVDLGQIHSVKFQVVD